MENDIYKNNLEFVFGNNVCHNLKFVFGNNVWNNLEFGKVIFFQISINGIKDMNYSILNVKRK